jgi:GT2 family glycosyltransferase/glycosyltransferase involved in cell wall biosynthesis
MNLNNLVKNRVEQAQLNKIDEVQNNTIYDIIIPVFNGFEVLQKNLDSIIKHTKSCHQIYYVNDASTDSKIKPWLNKINKKYKHINIVNNDENLGYLHNVNKAMLSSKKDIILLNSDTIVTANWLEELSIIAAHPKIAIVCPLSDNATILTLKGELLPFINKLNDFSSNWYNIPTAVGSCMLIKRDIINEQGVFDEYYHPGYGEECDYSFNLRNSGYFIACAPASFVYHAGSSSFKSTANILKQQHQKLLDLRWPQYSEEIQKFSENNPLLLIEEHLSVNTNDNNILHVVHGIKNKGGVELFTKELIEKLPNEINNTILIPGTSKLSGTSSFIENLKENIRCFYYQYTNQINLTKIGNQNADLTHEKLDIMLARMLLVGQYKLVHFHSFVGIGSLIWPLICRYLGIPYIISSHDHYTVCFNYSLLTNHYSEFCKKTLCNSQDNECVKCLDNYTNYNPISTTDYIDKRNEIWQKILTDAEHIILPSHYLLNLIVSNNPQLNLNQLHVVEPYDYSNSYQQIKTTHNKQLCIGFLGVFTHEKGAQIFIDAYQHLKNEAITWKIIGDINPRYSSQLSKTNIVTTGMYDRLDLPVLLNDIDVVIIPSIRPETYCITLTEAWLNGIPVIGADCGALSTRIKENINGLLFESENAVSLTKTIMGMLNNTQQLLDMKNHLKQQQLSKKPSHLLVLNLYEIYLERNNTCYNLANSCTKHFSNPSESSYSEMERWLSSEMTLEAASDWREPSQIDIIILGNNQQLCNRTLNSCNTYAKQSNTYIVSSIDTINLGSLSKIICLVNEGSILNDNFGNWIDSFESSQKAISLADYALINDKNQIYAPHFYNVFDKYNYLRQKTRIGALLINRTSDLEYLKSTLFNILQNKTEIHSVIDKTLDELNHDSIHYFPHLSYLYTDYKWAAQWKEEIAKVVNTTNIVRNNVVSTLSIIIFSNLNAKSLYPYITAILEQNNITISHIYVFSSHYSTFSEESISAHYVDFNQPENYVNSVLKRDNSEKLLFINDNLIFKDKNIISNMVNFLKTEKFQAVSPIYDFTNNSNEIYAEKLGNGILSGKGVIADIQFSHKQFPISTQLLDEDCFLIKKEIWNELGGFDSLGNVYFRANCLSNKLSNIKASVALLPIQGIYKKNLPSYILFNNNISLKGQRDELIQRDKQFYRSSKFISKSLSSQGKNKLDLNFGTFKTPKNLPRVLAYAHDSWASGFYRIKAPVSALVAANKISSHFLPNNSRNITASAFEINKQSPDVLLLHNFLSLEQIDALKQYKQLLDISIVLSFDDLLTSIPEYNHYSKSNPSDIHERIKKAAQYADKIIVTTEYLKQEFSIYHDNIIVIKNTLPCELWKKPKRNFTLNTNKKLRIGWAGAAQHLNDLEWLKPVIEATHQNVQWVFYGYMPDSYKLDYIEFHKHTAFHEYHLKLEQLNLDIAIAPLEHNSFNYAKSNLKLLEYGALSIPTISSNTVNYNDSPALKLDNDTGLWINAINQLADNLELRIELGNKMHDWVNNSYFLEDSLEQWLTCLNLKA